MKSSEEAMLTMALRPEEGNLIIEALAECPFKQVYELIGKLNRQANAGRNADMGARQDFLFTSAEMKLTLAALGNLPFSRVHLLMGELHHQMQEKPQKKRLQKGSKQA
jgi:hypothetical protein